MRTHTYSIAIAHLSNGSWTVAIVRTTLRRGVIVDRDLVYGPVRCPEAHLQAVVSRQVQQLQDLVAQDEAARPAGQ